MLSYANVYSLLQYTATEITHSVIRRDSKICLWNGLQKYNSILCVTCLIPSVLGLSCKSITVDSSYKQSLHGKWLWLSWWRGCFQYQRSEVRNQSSAKINLYRIFVYCQLCVEKTKIKIKRGREWPFLKKTISTFWKLVLRRASN